MILRDLVELVNTEKRKKERVKTVKKFAVGIGAVAAAGVAAGILVAPKSGKETREDMKNGVLNTIETIKDTVRENAESVKDSAAYVAKEAGNAIKGVNVKSEGVRKDIKDGYHKVTKDIHKTAANISNELNKIIK